MTFAARTIRQFHEGLVNREFTALEALQEIYKDIDRRDGELGAYLHENRDAACMAAEAADIVLAEGKRLPLLAGVPLAIKDNILIKGDRCTAASRMLETYRAAYDATVIAKLKAQGAVFVGKTNLDEFAMGSSTEYSAFKITKNPHNPAKVPGGSSGGSAAAVAANLAVAALGSDTGGSIRQPADFCNVAGLKPTYGAVSRYGLIAMASSLDQIGPIAKTVEDAALLFKEIAGEDPLDATSAGVAYGDELIEPKLEHIRQMTIGLPEEYFVEGLVQSVRERIDGVIAALSSLGMRFKKISLPHTPYALSAYYVTMMAEASANLARFDGMRYAAHEPAHAGHALKERYAAARSRGFGAEPKRRILAGTFVLSAGHYDAYYGKAQAARALIRRDFDEAFETVDALLAPVSPTEPFTIGEKTDDPVAMYLSDIFSVTANLAGLPALTAPPGFQLIGKPWREADIIGIGMEYERITSAR